MDGVVSRILPGKGYGFIRGADGISRFFNAADVKPVRDFDLIHEGQSVTFESVEGNAAKGNGLRAKEVVRAEA